MRIVLRPGQCIARLSVRVSLSRAEATEPRDGLADVLAKGNSSWPEITHLQGIRSWQVRDLDFGRRSTHRRLGQTNHLQEAGGPPMRTLTRTLIAAPVAMVMVAVAAPSAPAQLSEPPAPIQTYAGDPGRFGDPASWRTPEFNRDVGLVSIGAEYAYAAGYAGAGMSIGVVDSGVFAGHMREHGSLATDYAVGDRYFSVPAQGGDTGLTPGFYDPAFNDT